MSTGVAGGVEVRESAALAARVLRLDESGLDGDAREGLEPLAVVGERRVDLDGPRAVDGRARGLEPRAVRGLRGFQIFNPTSM